MHQTVRVPINFTDCTLEHNTNSSALFEARHLCSRPWQATVELSVPRLRAVSLMELASFLHKRN
jgi:hypothetical protein